MSWIDRPLCLIRDEPGVPAGGDGQEEEPEDHGEQHLHQPSDVLELSRRAFFSFHHLKVR